MTTVKITQRYTDIELNTRFEAGTVREVTEERAEALVNANVAEIISINHDEPVEEKKPVKKATRKATKKSTRKTATRKTKKSSK